MPTRAPRTAGATCPGRKRAPREQAAAPLTRRTRFTYPHLAVVQRPPPTFPFHRLFTDSDIPLAVPSHRIYTSSTRQSRVRRASSAINSSRLGTPATPRPWPASHRTTHACPGKVGLCRRHQDNFGMWQGPNTDMIWLVNSFHVAITERPTFSASVSQTLRSENTVRAGSGSAPCVEQKGTIRGGETHLV